MISRTPGPMKLFAFLVGGEKQIGIQMFQELGIGGKWARIAVKVFVRAELEWVYKNGSNDSAIGSGKLPRQGDKLAMSGVKCAHGGYKNDGAFGCQQRSGGTAIGNRECNGQRHGAASMVAPPA